LISPFFAGLRPATTASLLATIEPLATVLLAFVVFGEALGSPLCAGPALVLQARRARPCQVATPGRGTRPI
jgi:hypothetical protein